MDNKKQIYSGIGGQAVLEGIMMKNKDRFSVAVRKPTGEIAVIEDSYRSIFSPKIGSFPFIRGMAAFVDSMVLGFKTLSISAEYFENTEGENGDKKEAEENASGSILETAVMAFSVVLGIILFVLFPAWIAEISGKFLIIPRGVMEGLLRIGIFVIYIKIVSINPDIKRTFEYHGAEHKCINCIEHGLPLTVENVMKSSKEHKRCGTSFIVYVMLISIVLFMMIRTESLITRFLLRLVLIPVIAGISYEVLRIVGKNDNLLTRLLFIPGKWMQALTTKEPDEKETEVAIAAVEKVFDWREFEKEWT